MFQGQFCDPPTPKFVFSSPKQDTTVPPGYPQDDARSYPRITSLVKGTQTQSGIRLVAFFTP